jgi:hypothetical protein
MTAHVQEKLANRSDFQKTLTLFFEVTFHHIENEGEWLENSPEAKAAFDRGIADLKAGKVHKRPSYAHLAI